MARPLFTVVRAAPPAVTHIACPKCKAAPGRECQTPQGSKASRTHRARTLAYFKLR